MLSHVSRALPFYAICSMFVCREGHPTHLFFPGRVGRGYGPEWTLAVVSPAQMCWLGPESFAKLFLHILDSSWKTGSWLARIYAGNFGPRLSR